MKPTAARVITDSIPREAQGWPCPCGGFADRVEPTQEEDRERGCGVRYCCSRVFVCRICKARLVGIAEAPEMDNS